jgi:hypothetical protein
MKFQRVGWSEQLKSGLGETLRDDEQIIRQQIDSGRAIAYCINSGQAWLVIRPDGTELVIMCLKGEGARQIVASVAESAKKQGFKTMRAHTQRRGLLRMFKEFGAVEREIVIGVSL